MKERLEPLIAERAPWLGSGRFPLFRAAIDRVLGFDQTVALAQICEPLPSDRIMRIMGALIACNVTTTGRENIPRHGPALIVANHPTGIADGIILHHILSAMRPDLYFYANGDILRLLPQMADLIAPVEWRVEKRCHSKTRETMEYTRRAIEAGRMGVIFPSGRLAKRRGLTLHERPWLASAAMLARKFDLPVIPLHIQARNSALFYLFDLIHPTLRDITLFHETMNKKDQPYTLTIGKPIPASHLPNRSEDAIAHLRAATLGLGGAKAPAVSLLRASRRPTWLEGLQPLP